MQLQAEDYSEYHRNSRHLNFHQVHNTKDKANQLHSINKYIQRPRPPALLRREKKLQAQPESATENQFVKLAYRPGRSIKSACMITTYLPKNLQKKTISKLDCPAATIESHLMLDSKFTKTPAGVISFPSQLQKRPFSSQSQPRQATMNSHQTSHLQISGALARPYSKSRQSRQMFQGLKYGQAASMSCTTKQSQVLNNYKNAIRGFDGLTLLERKHNFKEFSTAELSRCQDHVYVSEPTNTDYHCSVAQKPKVMFPSQFQSSKSGQMGFEERPNVGTRQVDVEKALQGLSASKVSENREPARPANTWHARMFSKTKVYQSEAENCTDGITLPISYFDLMPKKEIEQMLELYEMRHQKDGSASISSGLLVSVNTIVTHFNVDLNKLHKDIKNDLIEQLSSQDGQSESNSAPRRRTTLCHIAKIDFSRSSDDDTATLPAWVFPSLQLQVGEPVVVSLDRQIVGLQSVLNERYILKQIQLEPLQTNYLEMGMQDKRNQESDKQMKEEKKDHDQLRHKDNQDSIKLGIQHALKSYRILKPNKILKFFTNNKTYEFQIRGLNNDEHAFYINSQNQKLEIELITDELLAQTPAKPALTARKNSISNKTKHGSNRQEKQQHAGIDLDLILKERGLDIFYMDDVINEFKGLNQKREEFKEVLGTCKTVPSKTHERTSQEKEKIEVEEVMLKTTIREGDKLQNMLGDIDSSDQSCNDRVSLASLKTKSNDDLRLRLLPSKKDSTPPPRESHSDVGTPGRRSRRSKNNIPSSRSKSRTQGDALADLAVSPQTMGSEGLLPIPGLSTSPKILNSECRGSQNFQDGIALKYDQFIQNAQGDHVLVTNQGNLSNRARNLEFRMTDATPPQPCNKGDQIEEIKRTTAFESFPELLRKKEKALNLQQKINDQILEKNNLRSPIKYSEFKVRGSRQILSEGPSFNKLGLAKRLSPQGEGEGEPLGLEQFEHLLLKQQFKEQFDNIDQTNLQSHLYLAIENKEDGNKYESASSQGQPALLETAMLPALPADIEPEVVAVDAVINAKEDGALRRESLPLPASPENPVKAAPRGTERWLAPFVKENICLKVNNQPISQGPYSTLARKPVEKNNTELKTSFQTLGDVLNSAKFGRPKAGEASVTDFLTLTANQEKEASGKGAPTVFTAQMGVAVGASLESENQFKTNFPNANEFPMPTGDFSVFVVPRDFRVAAVKRGVSTNASTSPGKAAAGVGPALAGETNKGASGAGSRPGGGDTVSAASLMRKWASNTRSHNNSTSLRTQLQKSQKIASLHNYKVNEISKRIGTTLFTASGMQPIFSPTLAIDESETEAAGGLCLAPTVYAALAPEAEFTPQEKKLFQDLHEMMVHEQYARGRGGTGRSERLFAEVEQAAQELARVEDTFGQEEDGTQDLVKQGAAGEESELLPSASPKTHNQTQRKAEEPGQHQNENGSNKVTERSEGTARRQEGERAAPVFVPVVEEAKANTVPSRQSIVSGETEAKAVVRPTTESGVTPNPALTPSSDRSKHSRISQVVFSKKHVHQSQSKSIVRSSKPQDQDQTGTNEEPALLQSVKQLAQLEGATPDCQASPEEGKVAPQPGATGADWDQLGGTEQLLKASTKTCPQVQDNADLGSGLQSAAPEQQEVTSPVIKPASPARAAEKKYPAEELKERSIKEQMKSDKASIQHKASVRGSTKCGKTELKPATWRQINQNASSNTKQNIRHVRGRTSNWEQIKGNFAKLQGGQTSETQKYSVYGSNLQPSHRPPPARVTPVLVPRSQRQRSRGLKTLCVGERNEYNHHNPSIPHAHNGAAVSRPYRGKTATARPTGNLNKGFSFEAPTEPLSGVQMQLIKAYPNRFASLFRQDPAQLLNYDLLRLNHDYRAWEVSQAQTEVTRQRSACRTGDGETHGGSTYAGGSGVGWSGYVHTRKPEAETAVLSNQTLGIAQQILESSLEQQ